MGLSPHQVRINFDRAMAMVNRCDSRSYAQVVSQPCASNFSHFCHMANNKGFHNTQVTCHTIYPDNSVQSVDKIEPESQVSTSYGVKQLVNADSDLNVAHFPRARRLDTCSSGRTIAKSPAGQFGSDPCVIPTKNRFLMLSESDADVESEELAGGSDSDLTRGCSFSNVRASNGVEGYDNGSGVHNGGSIQLEDRDILLSNPDCQCWVRSYPF